MPARHLFALFQPSGFVSSVFLLWDSFYFPHGLGRFCRTEKREDASNKKQFLCAAWVGWRSGWPGRIKPPSVLKVIISGSSDVVVVIRLGEESAKNPDGLVGGDLERIDSEDKLGLALFEGNKRRNR